jgi:hypothetical protein
MMSISNRIVSGIFYTSVFESESGHKYENKYDISDIRPYLIRFHPCLSECEWLPADGTHFRDSVPGLRMYRGKKLPPKRLRLRLGVGVS